MHWLFHRLDKPLQIVYTKIKNVVCTDKSVVKLKRKSIVSYTVIDFKVTKIEET